MWAAGNVGAQAHVWAVDGTSGVVVADVTVPGGAFLNDLVVTRDAVWVTDSRVDRLTRIAVAGDGQPLAAEPTFLALTGDWPAYDGTNLNANGIRELPDGSLVLDNSAAGGLWHVDPASGETQGIVVRGGPGLVGGDGLEIDGTTLYDVRGSGQAEVSVLELARQGPAGPLAGAVPEPTRRSTCPRRPRSRVDGCGPSTLASGCRRPGARATGSPGSPLGDGHRRGGFHTTSAWERPCRGRSPSRAA